VSYPAIDSALYTGLTDADIAAVMRRRGLERNRYVLFLSRLSAAKGVNDLISGYARSRSRNHVKLVIAGNGPEAVSLRAWAATSPAAEQIMFLDDVDDAEKPALMAGSCAFALPSKPRPEFVETFGIALVEKMLAGGGPVITTAHRRHPRSGRVACARRAGRLAAGDRGGARRRRGDVRRGDRDPRRSGPATRDAVRSGERLRRADAALRPGCVTVRVRGADHPATDRGARPARTGSA
jgi:hypothetical protein